MLIAVRKRQQFTGDLLMASARHTAANRANSKKSTGPRSVKGKAVARHNALKHGLTAGAASAIVGEDAHGPPPLLGQVDDLHSSR